MAQVLLYVVWPLPAAPIVAVLPAPAVVSEADATVDEDWSVVLLVEGAAAMLVLPLEGAAAVFVLLS
jgi:hypothetical protein